MADDIRGIELIVFAEKKPDQKGRSWKLRLVHWVIDGKSTSVKLERRGFFQDEYGVTKTGKAEGLKLEDLRAIKAYDEGKGWTTMTQLMESPPPIPDRLAEKAGDEEVPF